MVSIYVTGAIIMFVSAAIFDRKRVQRVRRDGEYWNKTWGVLKTDDIDAVMNALLAYVTLALFWPATMPIAILGIALGYFTRP